MARAKSILISALLLLAVSSALAEDYVTLECVADAYVNEEFPLQNYNTDHLVIGPGGIGFFQYSYLKFNMNMLPAGAQVLSATLEMDVNPQHGFSQTVYGSMVDGEWSETGITALTQPPWGDQLFAQTVNFSNDEVGFDILAAVQDWQNNPNNGVVLIAIDEEASFDSREWPVEEDRPRLIVGFIMPPDPSITVTDPTGSTVWDAGTTENANWTYQDLTGDVEIDLYKGGNHVSNLVASVPIANLTENFTVPGTLEYGTDYQVRVRSLSDGTEDYSPNFTINPQLNPQITITDPTTGTIWTAPGTENVWWTYQDLSGTIDIDLYLNGSFNRSLASGVNLDSSPQSVELPLGMSEGSTYQVRIYHAGSGIEEYSPEFTIQLAPNPELTVTEPTASTVWTSPGAGTVAWTYLVLTGPIEIDLYLDGTFHSVLESAVAIESSPVTVDIPENLPESGHYQVRLYHSTSQMEAFSAEFTIQQQSTGWDWVQHAIFDTYDNPYWVFGQDMNQDSSQDILVAWYTEGVVGIFENDGTGDSWTFNEVDSGLDTPFNLHGGDANNDGLMDAVAAVLTDAKVVVYLQQLNGTWLPVEVQTNYAESMQAMFADMDNDGDLDVIGGANGDAVSWWENDGSGLNWERHSQLGGGGYRSVYAGDIDGDGDQDIAGSNIGGQLSWWANDGSDGQWPIYSIGFVTSTPRRAFLADVDSDGDLDYVSSGRDGENLRWWENLGSGANWHPHVVEDNLDGCIATYAADLDQDGDVDLVSAAAYAHRVTIWENLGGVDSWAPHDLYTDPAGVPVHVHGADFDGDGDTDIVAAMTETNEIIWWENPFDPPHHEPIDVVLTPAADPTVVQAGQSFMYDLSIAYNHEDPAQMWVWTEATLPNGNPYGPVFEVRVPFTQGMVIDVDNVQQSVPISAPLGNYVWTLNVGLNRTVPLFSDSFPFAVTSPFMGQVAGSDDWTSVGHDRLLAEPENSKSTVHLPAHFEISAAYPNPFNSAVSFAVHLPEDGQIELKVFDITGREVSSTRPQTLTAGRHIMQWTPENQASGIYFIRASWNSSDFRVQKVMYVR